MRRLILMGLGLAVAGAIAACGPRAGTLEGAAAALGAARCNPIEFSGSGRWFQFGQAPSPALPWPQFDVSRPTAPPSTSTRSSARVRMTRRQTVEPGRARPTPVSSVPNNWSAAGSPGTWPFRAAARRHAAGRPAHAGGGRGTVMEIWSTPHGFVKAAVANNATVAAGRRRFEVTFTAAGHRYAGPSTRRTRWSGSAPGSTTPFSATRSWRPCSPTTGTSAA